MIDNTEVSIQLVQYLDLLFILKELLHKEPYIMNGDWEHHFTRMVFLTVRIGFCQECG